VRSLLHAPRPRTRSIAAATLGALALIGSLLVATPAQALNDTGTGGVFVPSTGRILDTAKGTGGFNTPMEAGKYRTIKVAGLAGLPDDGSVGAVSLNATVGASAGAGTLFGRPNADTGRATMLIYNGVSGEYTSNTATVAVGADGTIQVMTETASRLILDVQGYYTANTDGTAAGGFVSVAKRIVDTRSGLGAPKAALAPGKSVDVQITGANGIPSGASGVVVNLIAINGTDADGYLTPYATGATKPANSLHYAPSESTSIQAQVPLSADGKLTITNSSTTANLLVDLQGYFTAAGKGGAVFTPAYGRAYDSRATGNTALTENETRSIQIAGTAGVPVMGSGITAVVLTLIVAHGGSNGYADAWADGTTKPNTSAINFQTNEIQTNTITVPLGANGKISLRNAAKATNYVVDVQGWYTTPKAPTITCGDTAAGSWAKAIPDEDVACVVTAAAASTSNSQLVISVDGEDWDTVALGATTNTTSDAVLPASPGAHSIVATLDGATTSFGAGFGDWASAGYIPQPDNGSTTNTTPELGVLSNTDLLPSNASITYAVYANDAASTPLWTGSADDEGTAAVPSGVLTVGQTYSWSATIVAPSAGSASPVTRATPRYTFVTSSGEAAQDEVLSYTGGTGQTLGEIIDNAAASQGSEAVSNALSALASTAQSGTDIGFAPTDGLSTADTAAALQSESDRLAAEASGAAGSDGSADASASSSSAASTGAVSHAASSWNTYVAKAKVGGGKARDGRTWITNPVLYSGVCSRSCRNVDVYTTHVVFDPNLNKSRFETTVTRNVSERNVIGGVNFEARVYRLKNEVGHYSKTSRGKSGYKKVWVTLSSGLAGNDVTMWAQVSGRSDTSNKAPWRSDTAGCNSEHCDWDFK